MRLSKSNLYLALVFVILGLAGLAYYANEQTKMFSDGPKGADNLSTIRNRDQTTPKANQSSQQSSQQQTPGQQQEQTLDSGQFPPAPQQKIESYILETSEFTAEPGSLTAAAGSKVNIIVKAHKYYSGPNGLQFKSVSTADTIVLAGESKTISFTADKSFNLEVYKYGIGDSPLYVIPINIK